MAPHSHPPPPPHVASKGWWCSWVAGYHKHCIYFGYSPTHILSSAANKLAALNWTISWRSQSNTEKLKGKGFLSVNVLQPPQPVAYYAVMSPFRVKLMLLKWFSRMALADLKGNNTALHQQLTAALGLLLLQRGDRATTGHGLELWFDW